MATTPSYTAPAKLYTVAEAAEYLRVSERQVYRWLNAGLIEAVTLPEITRRSHRSRRKPGRRVTGESIARMLAPVK